MVLSLGILTSCAGESPPGAPAGPEDSGDQPTSAPAATHPGPTHPAGEADSKGTEAPPEKLPVPVHETQQLVSEHLSSWQEYSSPSETELQMAFYSGNPACYGVRSVVEESAEEVRVATISGTLPDAVDSACTQEARYVSVVIELNQPLGDRAVLPLTEVELAR